MVSASLLAGLLVISGSGASHVSLLYFTSDTCSACRSVRPTVQRLVAAGYPVSTVNLEREPDLARQFRITAVPTFILMKDGEELERLSEAASATRLVQLFERASSTSGPSPARFANVGGAGPFASQAVSQPPGPPAVQRAQSPAGGGFQLPRPFAALARGFGQRREPQEESLVQIEQPPVSPDWSVETREDSPQPPRDGTVGRTSSPSFGESAGVVGRTSSPSFADPSAGMGRTGSPSYGESAGGAGRTGSPSYGESVGAVGRTSSPSSGQGASVRPDANVQGRAVAATVRLHVDDLSGHAIGTGTIIDAHGDEALVLTCGHLFRDSSGRGRIVVDVFVNGVPQQVPGTLIRYDLERDLGFVAIPAAKLAPVMRVAPSGYRLDRGQPVFSVGCDLGQDPSLRESQITGIDRYIGAPNIEVAGQPVEGRSGGGLFTADGYLIGVCNGADKRDNEGVFASLPAIQWELDRIGQRRVYADPNEQIAQPTRRAAEPTESPAFAAMPHPNSTPRAATPLPATRLPATPPRAAVAIEPPTPLTSIPPASGVAVAPPIVPPATAMTSNDTEVICIVRSRANPQGTEQLLILDRPSPELLDRLSHESRGGPVGLAQQSPSSGSRMPANAPVNRFDDRAAPQRQWNEPQVIRAQSETGR